jgi:hypothetical protein
LAVELRIGAGPQDTPPTTDVIGKEAASIEKIGAEVERGIDQKAWKFVCDFVPVLADSDEFVRLGRVDGALRNVPLDGRIEEVGRGG